MNHTRVLFLPRYNLTKLQVSCRRITRFIDRCEMEQFSRLLFVRSSTLEEACTIVATRTARCVTAYHARNHGITGCRSRLMSLQGVPDRIISLDGAPRELFSPPERMNRARRSLMSGRSGRQVVYQTSCALLKSAMAGARKRETK